jgi:hypothetical protein
MISTPPPPAKAKESDCGIDRTAAGPFHASQHDE